MSHDLTLVTLSSIIWLLRIGVFHCNLFSLFYMGHPQVDILCFYLPRNITWTLHWGAILINRWEFFAVCHDPDKSCNHEHCDSGDMFSIQHVTSREYMFKDLSEFPGWKSLTLRHHLAMFGGHWFSASGDMKYLLCHITSHNHVIEGSRVVACHVLSWAYVLY